MICLCCGKKLDEKELSDHGWHKGCIKNFFGTNTLPEIAISDEELERLANEAVNKRLTVTGVQKKLSLHLSKDDTYRLTVVDYPTGYILKPQTQEYRHLPEYEHASMQMAGLVGIETVSHALIEMQDGYGYITRREDRRIKKEKIVKYAMEDFCQLAGKQTADKYKGSYEQCGKLIDRYSDRPGFDKTELFLRSVFSFVIGNSDMHLKNFSLIEDASGSRMYHLSPAYDMLPVNLVLPEDQEQTALMLNGKKKNLRRKDFVAFGSNIGLSEKVIKNLINEVCSKADGMHNIINSSLLATEEKTGFSELLDDRIRILTGEGT